MSVTLNNVNLRSCLGMSICAHAQELRCHCMIHALHEDVGTTFLGNGGWGGQRVWAFAMYALGGVKCKKGVLNAADGSRL